MLRSCPYIRQQYGKFMWPATFDRYRLTQTIGSIVLFWVSFGIILSNRADPLNQFDNALTPSNAKQRLQIVKLSPRGRNFIFGDPALSEALAVPIDADGRYVTVLDSPPGNGDEISIAGFGLSNARASKVEFHNRKTGLTVLRVNTEAYPLQPVEFQNSKINPKTTPTPVVISQPSKGSVSTSHSNSLEDWFEPIAIVGGGEVATLSEKLKFETRPLVISLDIHLREWEERCKSSQTVNGSNIYRCPNGKMLLQGLNRRAYLAASGDLLILLDTDPSKAMLFRNANRNAKVFDFGLQKGQPGLTVILDWLAPTALKPGSPLVDNDGRLWGLAVSDIELATPLKSDPVLHIANPIANLPAEYWEANRWHATVKREIAEAHRAGDYNTMKAKLGEALLHSPEDPWLMFRKAVALLRLDDKIGAIKIFERLVSAEPSYSAPAAFNLALLKPSSSDEARRYSQVAAKNYLRLNNLAMADRARFLFEAKPQAANVQRPGSSPDLSDRNALTQTQLTTLGFLGTLIALAITGVVVSTFRRTAETLNRAMLEGQKLENTLTDTNLHKSEEFNASRLQTSKPADDGKIRILKQRQQVEPLRRDERPLAEQLEEYEQPSHSIKLMMPEVNRLKIPIHSMRANDLTLLSLQAQVKTPIATQPASELTRPRPQLKGKKDPQWQRAQDLKAQGRYLDALSLLNRMLRREPEDFEALAMRSELRFLTLDYSGAIEDIEESIEIATELDYSSELADLEALRKKYSSWVERS